MKLFEEPELILLHFNTEDILNESATYDDEDLGEWN
jgi:hypothetical protein